MVLAFAPIAGHHIIGWIIIGILAGAIAGRLVAGGGFGLLHDMVLGLAGAVIGGLILHAATGRASTSPSFLTEFLVALAGAAALLLVARVLSRRRVAGGSRRW